MANALPDTNDSNPSPSQNATKQPYRAPLLFANGSCWYCGKALDKVRKFCGTACAEGHREEEEFNHDVAGYLEVLWQEAKADPEPSP